MTTLKFSAYLTAFLAANPGASIAEVYSPTALLPGAVLKVYDGKQPATPDTVLSGNNLCAQFLFPISCWSVITPGGIFVLDPIGDTIFLISSTASWARCITGDAAHTLFDCSVDDAAGSNSGGVQADLVLNINPFVAGYIAKISNGQPDPFFSAPYLGNSVMLRSNK